MVVIAASTGGIDALGQVLGTLPADLPAAVVVLLHRLPSPRENHLNAILERATKLRVMSAREGDTIEPGTVYVARSDLHLMISGKGRFAYVDGARIRYLLASANPLFESAAVAFRDRLIGVVLTGNGSDATDGVQTIRAHGGIVIVQDPAGAAARDMPLAAIRSGAASLILPLAAIGPALDDLARERPIASAET